MNIKRLGLFLLIILLVSLNNSIYALFYFTIFYLEYFFVFSLHFLSIFVIINIQLFPDNWNYSPK